MIPEIFSSPPSVTLTKAFTTPYDNAVATARTCYSSRVITDADVSKDERALELRDQIAESTYQAGHHTTLQHAHFQFAIENISRQALWSFFHSHPFYNSEQVSQRYVEVKEGRYIVPRLPCRDSQERFENTMKRQMGAYKELLALLHPAAEAAYFSIYKGRQKNKEDKRWQSAIKKRCQEVARYVLPIGTHSHLYHTVSGLTLHRYHRLAQSHDCPYEQKLLVNAMIEAVQQLDPLFFRKIEDTIPLENTHEALFFSSLPSNPSQFITEFDQQLGNRTSRLMNVTPNATELMAQAVRQTFAIPSSILSDEQAVDYLLNPSINTYLGESLSLNTLGKATRALELVQFTFMKKMSHSADCQAQRHRMTPGVRPVLWTHVIPEQPDFITPRLFEHPLAQGAKALFEKEMKATFNDIAYLVNKKASPEIWQYLLPNAFPIRYTDTGSLLDHQHKWAMRLCYNAQEEIWQSALDEVQDVETHYPQIGKFLLPPCTRRSLAKQTPVCPEGARFCGVPVWRLEKKDYLRVL